MRRFLSIILAILAFASVANAASPKRELRSVWFTTHFAIDWPSVRGTSASTIATQKAELIAYIEKFKSRNMNGICFQVRSLCDAMYQSSYEPWSSMVSGTRGTNPGWDPLAFAVEECHKRGMECWAWVNPFRQRLSTSNYSNWQDVALANNGWLLSYTLNGSTKVVLNPGIAAARQRILAVCREIYTNYKIDGMLFDDYFYPDGIPTTSAAGDYNLWKNSGSSLNFGDWRRENINKFMRELRAQINADRPDMRFGVSPAGVAYLGASKYGFSKPNISSTDWQYGTIFSDPIAWLAEGSIDFISPQIYWPTTHSTAPYEPLVSWWSNVANYFKRHFYSSQATYMLSDGTKPNNATGWGEISKEVNLNRSYSKNNAPGSIYYSAKYIDGPGLSGLGAYLLTNNYQLKSLPPVTSWKTRNVYAAPANLKRASSTLSWSATAGAKTNSIIRYTVYAIPTSVKTIAAAKASDGDGIDNKYLLDMCYSTSYTLPSDKTSGYWYAVCVLDGLGYESDPATVGMDPKLTATVTSYSYSCPYGDSQIYTFQVVGENLTDDITVTSNSSNFEVTKTTLTRAGGWIDVRFTPTYQGNFTGTLTCKSGTVSATISLTGVGTMPIPRFTEKWNISDSKSNATSLGWDAREVRNMEYYRGKLYLVYEQKSIKVINAKTGASLGDLNKAGVYGGTVKLADVKMCDGKLVASNIALTANNDPFCLYVWDDDHSNPRKILETKNFGGAHRIGDYIGFKGTWTSGEFLFCTDDGSTYTRLIRYAVTNGIVNPDPSVIYLTTDGVNRITTQISANVIPEVDGYWINGRACPATFVGLDGVKKFSVNQSNIWGNAFQSFQYLGSVYALTTAYDGNTMGTATKGRIRIINADNGWANARFVADYPEGGLSATRTNGNGTGGICTDIHSGTVEAWVLATNQGIAYYINQGGSAASYTVEPIRQIKPYIMTSRGYTNITAKTGQPASTPISISGAFLSDDISLQMVGTNASNFTLSTDKISFYSDVETIYVTFDAAATGSYSAQLEITSDGCDPVYITVNAQASGDNYFNEYVSLLSERWLFSETADNLSAASWFNNAARPARDMCIANFKLYVLSAKAWEFSPEIHIIGAYGGSYNGTLRMEGISGGETAVASIAEIGGHVIAANGARAAGVDGSSVTDPLKIYKWYNDDCAPTLWMQDNEHGGIHVGEMMSVYGDMTDGKILFSNGSKILIYPVSFGRLSSTPTIITLTRDGLPYSVGDIKGEASVTLLDDGTFWVTGKDCYATRFAADGSFIEEFNERGVAGRPHGTSSSFFTIGNRKYMVTSTYLTSGYAAGDLLINGAMAIVDYTDGVAKAVTTSVYPEDGLGTINNNSFQTKVLTEKSTDGERVNLWVLVPMQGIAYYKFDAADPSLYVEPLQLRLDVNRDGFINIEDAQIIINAMLGVIDDRFITDIDADDDTNISDAQLIINAMLGEE